MALLGLSTGCGSSDKVASTDLSGGTILFAPAAMESPKLFWAKNIRVKFFEKGLSSAEFSAGTLLKQRRSSQVFHYHNVTEVVAAQIQVRLSADREMVNDKFIGSSLRSLARALTSITGSIYEDSTVSQDADMYANYISHFQLDDLALNLSSSDRNGSALFAEHARLRGDVAAALLEGDVRFESNDCRIEAPIAIWSSEYDGLYFPQGYVRNSRKVEAKDFIYLSGKHLCQKMHRRPVISYVDPYDEAEQAVVSALFPGMPLPSRPVSDP